jgi:hypothetical protein
MLTVLTLVKTMSATNIIECMSYRETRKNLFIAFFLTIFACSFIMYVGFVLNLIVIFLSTIFIAGAVALVLYWKYSAQSMEIVENELRFFDKSGKLKFSLLLMRFKA